MARLATWQDSVLGMASTWSAFMTGSCGAFAGSLPRVPLPLSLGAVLACFDCPEGPRGCQSGSTGNNT